jgi:hypothetical protein
LQLAISRTKELTMMTRRWISVMIAGALVAACGSGDEETEAVDVPATSEIENDAAVDDTASDGDEAADDEAADDGAVDDGTDDAADSSDDAAGDASAAGSTGRLEIDGESYNLRLGDMPTAMCSVSDSTITIQDLRASDGSWVAVFYDASGDVLSATFRGPDGNRLWVIGNLDESDGLPFDFLIADNVFSVNGTWASVDDPSTTAEGRLVVTC